MKNYKVNEVAKLLDTNEETVRRWIRNNKLHASQQSRKTGNIISDDDLRAFLDSYPKYFTQFIASTTAVAEKSTAGILAGIGISLLGAAGVAAIKALQTKDDITNDDITSFAKNQIEKLDARIKQKRAAIADLEEEINDFQSQIDNYKKILGMGGEELEQAINAVKNAVK